MRPQQNAESVVVSHVQEWPHPTWDDPARCVEHGAEVCHRCHLGDVPTTGAGDQLAVDLVRADVRQPDGTVEVGEDELLLSHGGHDVTVNATSLLDLLASTPSTPITRSA